MAKTPDIRFFCEGCKKFAEPDKKQSTKQWDVLPPNCPDCGAKWTLKFKDK